MKPPLATVAVLALLAAAGVVSSRVAPAPASSTATALDVLPPAAPAGETTSWGHVKSLARRNGRWEMRFDPALMLHGAAAEHAALEDTGSKDVPNDAYVVDESHRLFTFVVAANARVTVLTRDLRAAAISVPELAQIVKGKNPAHRALFDRGNNLGYWILVGSKYPNPALRLDQQYQP